MSAESVPARPILQAEGGVVLRPSRDADENVARFAVETDGTVVGEVVLRRLPDRRAEVSWAVRPEHRGKGHATAAVRRLVTYAFDDLAVARVEARAEPGNHASLRVAARAGLRREGHLRARETAGDQRRDYLLFARLADDPDVRERDGFIGILNSSLPRKRVISQGLLHDRDGRILLCELTYKREWDLPGGVVEPDESPADGLVREIREELGIEVTIEGLRTINWLPAWRGWDDACVFVFELGTVDAELVAEMTLQRTEIVDVHWCDKALVRERATAVTVELLDALERGAPGYREHGR